MEAARLRVRLVFDGLEILSKSQKKNGLKRSWILLKPHLCTIFDVVSYLLHHFDLSDACPNGIVLYMDGFALPLFESTAILKDGDLIRVRKKGPGLHDLPKALEGAKTLTEDVVVDKRPLPSGMKLLANEVYDKKNRGYKDGTEVDKGEAGKTILSVENTCVGDVPAIKKRKASGESENAKAKRQRQCTPETVQQRHGHCMPIRMDLEKIKLGNGSKQDSPCHSKVTVKCTENLEPTFIFKECVEPETNKERAAAASGVPVESKKISRNTRRKSLQRKRKREQRAKDQMEKCETVQPRKNHNSDSGTKKDTGTNILEHQHPDEDSDSEGDLVPVVIRPGHIRFTRSGEVDEFPRIQETNIWKAPSTQKSVKEGHKSNKSCWDGHPTKKSCWKGQSSGKDGPSVQKNQVVKDQETSQWNGIINKGKGQKWGTEKQSTSSWRAYNSHSSGSWATRKQGPRVDFEKLVPLIDLPKAGDIVAYRLLELSSSSWCPQLSSFQIGKISWFEPESNRIMLVPDPEYPLNLGKKNKDHDNYASGVPSESSVYNEDGSLEEAMDHVTGVSALSSFKANPVGFTTLGRKRVLSFHGELTLFPRDSGFWIDFPSLVDVRIVKRGDLSESVDNGTPAANGTPAPLETSKRVNETHDGSKNVVSDVHNGEPRTPTPVNGKKDVWEDLSEALSAKKSQLAQEDSWNKKKVSSSGRSWSQRTLRGSALGPRMAMLRAQNGP